MDNPGQLRRPFFRALATERPHLLRAILRFNAGIHSGECTVKALMNGSNRVTSRLTGPYTEGFWDFEEESRRLALLSVETFERLIHAWGAAFCAPLINRVILRAEHEMLEERLGGPLLDFARGRGRFFMGDMTQVIPLNAAKAGDLPDLVPEYGLRAYRICSAPWPDALRSIQEKRIYGLRDRFPDVAPLGEAPHPAHLRAVWFSMKKVLLKEVAPEWIPCFS